LEIAGIGITLSCSEPAFLQQVLHRYPGFLSPPGPSLAAGPEYRLELETGPDLLPGDEAAPRITRDGDLVRLRRRDFHLDLQPATRALTGVVAGNVYSMDSLLRVFFTLALLEVDGLMLHGSAVRSASGGAFAFFGKSGAGKSTAARLSAPRKVFSDELVVLRRLPQGWQVFGTPFWGNLESHGENSFAPLQGLLSLVQDREVCLRPTTGAAGLRKLLGCVLFFANQEPWVSQATTLAAQLARETPVQTLHFLKDDTFWRLLEDAG
jgi:hypothetical protein